MRKLLSRHYIYLWVILALTFFVLSCQNSTKQNESASDATSSNSTVETPGEKPKIPAKAVELEPLKSKDLLYAWVDKLNIREKPGTSGKVVTTVQSDDALEFTGEKTDETETIVLRAVAYDEPWLKVITPDKKEGWVFGGAVKRKEETKGNGIIDDKKFDFPYFGSFNLKDWKKQSTKDESGGDAEILTTTYKKGDQILEISHIDVGDYGYGRTYKFMDIFGKTFRERELNFIADAEYRELREVVKDYASDPQKQYVRTQKFKKHSSQLNALPLMVNGHWTTSAIDDDNDE
ncbi:MAG: SH3 domain-containing protein [Bacteroidetes bacterium]|nr:SH3 domain-containing protein [Bacteroidota bacterium]